MAQTQELKRQENARAQAKCRSRQKSLQIAQENELKAKQEKRANLAMELAERNRQNKDSERKLLQARAMIASQRTEIEASQREDNDLKIQIQSLRLQEKFRMASCSSN
ncbi:hypothetical protein BJX66DRAFT_19233 [Aspergillus keveii]|uniref:Uncharacterized protein n=1 Tax=Aspergillus keveii TaxID=714993 RepID=A0ABR4FUV8_9EURO